MVTVGELAFSVDSRQFIAGISRMRAALRGFAKDAQGASVAFAPGLGGGRFGPGSGGGAVGPGRGPGGGGFAPGGSAVGLGLARGLGAGGLFAPLAAGLAGAAVLKRSISTIAEFEEAIAKVAGTTRATAADLQLYTDTARKAGAETRFTASEAAEGLLELARAGLTARESAIALTPSLQFATAAQLSLGDASDLATNIIAQFGLQVEDIRRVTDVVTFGANNTNTTVAELGRALRDAGVAGASLGVSLEDTVTALSLLASVGIKGQKAGVALRNIFANLGAEIQRDGLQETLENLSEAQVGFLEAAELVNVRGAPALTSLINKFQEYGTVLESLRTQSAGANAAFSATLDDTIIGSFRQLNSAFDEFILSRGDNGFQGLIRNTVDNVRDFFRAVNDPGVSGVSNRIKTLATSFNTLADFIGDAASAAGDLVDALDAIASGRLANADGRSLIEALTGSRPSNADIEAFRQRQATRSAADLAGTVTRGRAPGSLPVPVAPRTVVTGSLSYFDRFQDASNGLFGNPTAQSQAAFERTEGIRGVIGQLEQERRALQLSGAAREAYNASVAATGDAMTQTIPSINRMVEEIRALERQDRVFDSIAQGFASLGEEAIFAADNLEEAAQRIVESIARIGLQELALQPLADVIRSGLGGAFGGTARQQGAGGSYVVSGGGGHVAGGGYN